MQTNVSPGSGPELVRRVKTVRPQLPALLISGYTDQGIVHNGILDPGEVKRRSGSVGFRAQPGRDVRNLAVPGERGAVAGRAGAHELALAARDRERNVDECLGPIGIDVRHAIEFDRGRRRRILRSSDGGRVHR